MPDIAQIPVMGACEDGQFMFLARLPEQPNHRIEVKIRLQRALSIQAKIKLTLKLLQNNMQVVDDQQNNIIIVSGIPPHDQYSAQCVLADVEEFDAAARTVP